MRKPADALSKMDSRDNQVRHLLAIGVDEFRDADIVDLGHGCFDAVAIVKLVEDAIGRKGSFGSLSAPKHQC